MAFSIQFKMVNLKHSKLKWFSSTTVTKVGLFQTTLSQMLAT